MTTLSSLSEFAMVTALCLFPWSVGGLRIAAAIGTVGTGVLWVCGGV